ncbi:dual specificity protein phosphatase 8 [Dermacentor silvarum]|uniref:dual specificity protein phosphatase 8 n=1 Tax=Dermacentor silvarum TaxID=543639 RepID=UPI001899A290|nr:dual specificity protein phosphatase 8 [Dermacentor silvarum]XP_037581939.1 dual specificity protein phosphatase 8 [Dermacentor silvarum]
MADQRVSLVGAAQLAGQLRTDPARVLVIDSRPFLEFNTCHIRDAVNVCCSKIIKRRLQHDKVSVCELLPSDGRQQRVEQVVVYDQGSWSVPSGEDSFLAVLLAKLARAFPGRVALLAGGLLEFSSRHRVLCEDGGSRGPLTSLSQPCLSAAGPTRILPFLFLGSQRDAQDPELLAAHNICYELNVSTSCPKPDFIPDAHFLRIPVNDSHADKLRPHFARACRFLDKVRESSGCVLVHCLAGVSRSPTVAIAYVMRHLGLSSDDAYRYVKSKRPSISPNFNFLGQLLEYERELRGESVLRTGGAASAPVPVERPPGCCEEPRQQPREGERPPPLVRPAADPRWSLCRLSLDLRGSSTSSNRRDVQRSRSCNLQNWPLLGPHPEEESAPASSLSATDCRLPEHQQTAPDEEEEVVLRRRHKAGNFEPRRDTRSHDSAYRSLTLEDMAELEAAASAEAADAACPLAPPPLPLSPLSPSESHLLQDFASSPPADSCCPAESLWGRSVELEGSHDSGVTSASSGSFWGAPLRAPSCSSSSSSTSSSTSSSSSSLAADAGFHGGECSASGFSSSSRVLPRAQSCPVMLGGWLRRASSLDEFPPCSSSSHAAALARPRNRYSCGSLEAVLGEAGASVAAISVSSLREAAARRQTPYSRRSASLIPVS